MRARETTKPRRICSGSRGPVIQNPPPGRMHMVASFITHRALDGGTYQLEGDLYLQSPGTSAVEVAAGGRLVDREHPHRAPVLRRCRASAGRPARHRDRGRGETEPTRPGRRLHIGHLPGRRSRSGSPPGRCDDVRRGVRCVRPADGRHGQGPGLRAAADGRRGRDRRTPVPTPSVGRAGGAQAHVPAGRFRVTRSVSVVVVSIQSTRLPVSAAALDCWPRLQETRPSGAPFGVNCWSFARESL